MAIFLDWYIPGTEEGISSIMVLDDSNRTTFLRGNHLSEVISHMGGRELIVVYEKPLGQLKKLLEGYEHFLEDNNVRARWYDLFVEIRRESGYAATLSKVALGTLGEGKYKNIPRLQKESFGVPRRDIREKLEARVRALQAVFDYAVKYDQVSFTRGKETIWAELYINENI